MPIAPRCSVFARPLAFAPARVAARSAIGATAAAALLALSLGGSPAAAQSPRRPPAAAPAAAPAPAPASNGADRDAPRPDASWHVLVEQDGKVIGLDRRPTLKLAPFTLLFAGPASYSYVLVTARRASALPAAPDFATMKALVQPERLVAEKSDRTDHQLVINDDASIASRSALAHLWVEDAARGTHAFLRFDVAPDGRAIAMRPVSSLCRPSFRVDRPDCRDLSEIAARQAALPRRPRRNAPAARSTDDFAVLVAAIPSGKLTRFETPRVYEIRFEPPAAP